MECLHEFRFPAFRVDFDDQPARNVIEVHLVAVAVLGAMRGVVIQANDLLRPICRFGEETGVVLEGEFDVRAEFEARRFAAELPYNGACGAVDLVEGVDVASGDQIRIGGGVFVDRVDVKVVPGIGAVVAGACLARFEGKVGFWWEVS